MVFSLLMCYFYFIAVFGYSLSLSGMIDFLSKAASVSLLPVLALFAYLYVQYRDIRRSSLSVQDKASADSGSLMITLKGNNKDDVIRTKEDDNDIGVVVQYILLHAPKCLGGRIASNA